MKYKDKKLYKYLTNRGILLVAIASILFIAIIGFNNYPNDINLNINNYFLCTFLGYCMIYGFIDFTGRLIGAVSFILYKLTIFTYYKIKNYNENKNSAKKD